MTKNSKGTTKKAVKATGPQTVELVQGNTSVLTVKLLSDISKNLVVLINLLTKAMDE